MAGPVAGYLNLVYVRTDTTAPGNADKIDGIKDFSLELPTELLETTNFKQGTGVKTRVGGLQDASLELSGDFLMGDTIQALLRSNWAGRTQVYVTVILDASQSAGSQGYRIPFLIESYSAKSQPNALCEFSAKLQGNGAPVAV